MKQIIFALLFFISLGIAQATTVPISGLNPAATLTGSEIFPLDQSGTTVKATINQIWQDAPIIQLGLPTPATSASPNANSGIIEFPVSDWGPPSAHPTGSPQANSYTPEISVVDSGNPGTTTFNFTGSSGNTNTQLALTSGSSTSYYGATGATVAGPFDFTGIYNYCGTSGSGCTINAPGSGNLLLNWVSGTTVQIGNGAGGSSGTYFQPNGTAQIGGALGVTGAVTITGTYNTCGTATSNCVWQAPGAGALYLNYSTGTGGVNIGNGASGTVDTFSATGQLNALGALITSVGGDALQFTNGTSNDILWPASGLGAPTFTTRSAGTRLVLFPFESGSQVDYAIGLASGSLWESVGTTAYSFDWYGGTTKEMDMTGGGLTLGPTSTTGNCFGVETVYTHTCPAVTNSSDNGMNFFIGSASTLGYRWFTVGSSGTLTQILSSDMSGDFSTAGTITAAGIYNVCGTSSGNCVWEVPGSGILYLNLASGTGGVDIGNGAGGVADYFTSGGALVTGSYINANAGAITTSGGAIVSDSTTSGACTGIGYESYNCTSIGNSDDNGMNLFVSSSSSLGYRFFTVNSSNALTQIAAIDDTGDISGSGTFTFSGVANYCGTSSGNCTINVPGSGQLLLDWASGSTVQIGNGAGGASGTYFTTGGQVIVGSSLSIGSFDTLGSSGSTLAGNLYVSNGVFAAPSGVSAQLCGDNACQLTLSSSSATLSVPLTINSYLSINPSDYIIHGTTGSYPYIANLYNGTAHIERGSTTSASTSGVTVNFNTSYSYTPLCYLTYNYNGSPSGLPILSYNASTSAIKIYASASTSATVVFMCL
jgi:hypothetical protein